MNMNDNVKEIFGGGGVLLKADFHPPPLLAKKTLVSL